MDSYCALTSTAPFLELVNDLNVPAEHHFFTMDLTKKHIEYIKLLLQKGSTRDDLVSLINFVIELQNEQLQTNYKTISNNQLGYYLAKRDEKYIHFEIPKKSGGVRRISSPSKVLKKIQRRIAFVLEVLFTPRISTNGFVKQRSIVTNAKGHIGRKYIYNIDIKDFFPSIHYGRVKAVLQIFPFKASEEMAHLIAHLSCYKGILPQGSPLSPILTNIVCQSLDYHLVKLAQDHKCFYSRYADDITFSSNKNIYLNEKFLIDLKKVVNDQGFNINEKKTRLQSYAQRQEVTGVIVNTKPNLKRTYIKKLRAMLYNWENKGLKYCQNKLTIHYPNEKGFIRNKVVPDFENVLQGKIQFLGMIRGKDDHYYKTFNRKFNELKKN